jgi:hypothetical protein
MADRHRWHFHRFGGLDQVALRSADDLRHLASLDQTLWIALACPTRGLQVDERTLALLDTDGDGRVRVPEVTAAIAWCDARLADLGLLLADGDDLPLEAINAGTPEGKAIHAAALQLLASVGREGADRVTAADVADTTRVFEATTFNGDGVVPPESAEDEAARAAIADAIACVGGTADRSGRVGIDGARLEAFFAALAAHDAWWRAGQEPAVRGLGEATAAAHAAVEAVRAKVEDWFTRCRLAAMDPRGAALLNRPDAELTALGQGELSPGAAGVAALPLARVEAGRALPLVDGVNPAWAGALAALRRDAVAPALGDRAELSEAAWASLTARVAPYGAWLGAKKGSEVEKLGPVRVAALLAGGARAAVGALLERDLAKKAEAEAVVDVVRLVLYRRDLPVLLRNFVNFADFYDAGDPAVFQAGDLYIDGRCLSLCVRVEDAAAHAGLAGLSRLFIAYCQLTRPGGAAMSIAACVTQGDADYLRVGRRGVFYDRDGRDWDATVVRLVENPISIRQAFFSPYKKFLRAIEEQVARFAAAREKESDAKVSGAAGAVTGAVTGGKAAAPSPVDVGKMVGIVAALGVGIGALGTLFGGLVSGFLGLQPWWAKLVAVGGVVLIISGPSMLIAWLKLRQRTLGPVLEANGWAVNGRVAINLPLGASLTRLARLPPGASRSLTDPFEDQGARTRRRLLWLLVLLGVALAVARRLSVFPFGPWPF